MKDRSLLPTAGKWAMRLAPWLVIALYVGIAAYKLRFPGTQYDEALFVNAALGGVDSTTFLTKTFHGLPVLLMPYIGALKAYVFWPVFAIFGVSPLSMRLPSIALTAAALWVLYKLIQGQVGKRLALGVLALTALDASFIIFSRLDEGPVVIDFLLKVLGIGLLLRFARTRRLAWLGWFWVPMLLGVFNKLNFIWDVNALAGAFAVVYMWPLWHESAWPRRLRILGISAVGYAASVSYYLYINATYHLGSHLAFVGWRMVYNNLVALTNGSWFYNYAFSPAALGSTHVFWLMFIVIIFGLGALAYGHRRQLLDKRLSRLFLFSTTAFFLLVTQIAFTPQATAGWHYFSIYPLFGLSFVLAMAIIMRVSLPKRRAMADIGVAVVVAGLCIYQLAVYRQYVQAYAQPPAKSMWSTAIYQLSDFAKTQHRQFVFLDWGMQTQLLGFDPVPGKYSDAWFQDPAASFEQFVTAKPSAYYVTHAKDQRIMPAATDKFFAVAAAHGLHSQLVKTIQDGNRPVFEIYQLQP